MPRPDTGTKLKLIETAIDLIWTSSYGSVSVDDICKSAGVQKGSFYHYFPSKESLSVTALEHHFNAEMEPDLQKIFAANLSLPQQWNTLVDTIIKKQSNALEKYGRVCGCPFGALASEMIGGHEKFISLKTEDIFKRFQSYLIQSISMAIDMGLIANANPEEKALEIHNFITGQMMMSRIHNTLSGLEQNLKSGIFRILEIDTHSNTILKA